VLALRGRQVVQQPLQDDDGNVLVWNGEVFGGVEV
jgi:asparagine synthetase B (glutamine-hydrolysing)